MVTVNVRDENRADLGDIGSVTAESSQCRRRGIDDVFPVEHGKGMVSPVREKGIARPQHVHAVCHDRASSSSSCSHR